MKKYLLFSMMIILAAQAGAQVSEIHFTYDAAGNRLSQHIGTKAFYEKGVLELDQPDRSSWTTVEFEQSYTQPVVFMGPASYNGSDPMVLRVREVTGTSFQFQLQEWDYLDGGHPTEQLAYMVVERGQHSLGDLSLETGMLDNVSTTFQMVEFTTVFSSAPIVLTQVSSRNDSSAVVTRTRHVTDSTFEVKIQEEENNDDMHTPEQVGYIAIEQGMTEVDNYKVQAGLTGNSVTESPYTVAFNDSLGSPVLLADDQTYDGSNTSGLRCQNLSAYSVEIFCEEEASYDSEISHTTERIGYLVFESAGGIQQLSAPIIQSKGKKDHLSDTSALQPEEKIIDKAISIYPNPAKDKLFVELNGFDSNACSDLRMIRITGEVIQHIPTPGSINRLDLTGEPAGTYILRLQVEGKTREWKIMKQ